jgi:hypothetical protein
MALLRKDKITKVIVHCADTRIDQQFDIDDINNWHKDRGFVFTDQNGKKQHVGYHVVILQDGTVQYGRPFNVMGAHCREQGQNDRSLGVCFMGGNDEKGNKWDKPTNEQIQAFKFLLEDEITPYLGFEPPIYGHSDFSSKTCPNFDISILKK